MTVVVVVPVNFNFISLKTVPNNHNSLEFINHNKHLYLFQIDSL